MLQFAALPAEDAMSISNASVRFDFRHLLPANVEIVAWAGDDGIIEYNDRLRVTQGIGDPAPYAALIDAWIGVAAVLSDLPLTLQQARQIKTELINALFFYKRQVPYSYLGYQFSAKDVAVAAALPALVGGVAGDLASLVTQINTLVSQINSYLVARLNTAVATTTASLHQSGTMVSSPVNVAGPGLQSIPLNYVDTVGSGLGGQIVPWESISPSQLVNLSTAQASALMQLIAARTATLITTKLSKTAALQSLTTMAAVIAFDTTAGW